MPEQSEIIEAQIEKFDALREIFESEDVRCFLIKSAGNSNYTIVAELTGGWYQRWNEFRQQTRLACATLDASFADFAAQSSFFAYGVPDAENALDVFEIEDEQRDKVAPNGANPYWKFYGLRKPNERFTIRD